MVSISKIEIKLFGEGGVGGGVEVGGGADGEGGVNGDRNVE